MKKVFCVVVFFSVYLSWIDLIFAQKDPFDSFGTYPRIGLVVQDTSSLNSTYEEPIYDALIEAGHTVFKIDTTSMDAELFDSNALPWDTLDVAIICFGTDSAAVDTSISNGIKEVPLIVLEPGYWPIFFNGQDSTGTTTNDSILITNTVGHAFINDIWGNDSVAVNNSDVTMYKLTFGAFYPNGTKVARWVEGTTLGGLIAAKDTIGGHNVRRVQWGLADASAWATDQNSGWTLFNRCLAWAAGASDDSLFVIGETVALHGEAISSNNKMERKVKNHLEQNGHEVKLVSADSLGQSAPDPDYKWSDLNAIVYVRGTSPTRVTPVKDSVNAIIILGGSASTGPGEAADSLEITDGNPTTIVDQDSAIIVNVSHILTSPYDLNEIVDWTIGGDLQYSRSGAVSGSVPNAIGLVNDYDFQGETFFTLITRKDERWAYSGLSFIESGYGSGDLSPAGWQLFFDRPMGWILDNAVNPAGDVTLTALGTDSVKITWSDNSGDEDGFSIFVYEPDSAYWAHLAANTTADTIFYFWPPNSEVIADVAVISGTDTIFSVGGKDTVYTNAAIPPPVFTKNLTDTSMYFNINGYLFDERFEDEDYTASPVWTVISGSAEVDTVKRFIRATSTTDTTVLSTPFAASKDTLEDSEWYSTFRFSDSTTSNQAFSFYLGHKSSIVDSSGYQIAVTSSTGLIAWVRLTTSGGSAQAALSTTGLDTDELFKWHDLKIVRNTTISPFDTTIVWNIYLDGDSLLGVTDNAPYHNIDFIGIRMDSNDVRVDNIQMKQIRPSGNSSFTQYAVQDSVTGLYIHDAADTLRSAEDWRTYSELGGANGDTLTSLPKDSLIVLRSKSRNGNN